jgi:hypothetical protein
MCGPQVGMTQSSGTSQFTEGQGKQPEHTQAPQTHTHDHYHVSHHHRGGPISDWDHRTYWHTHEHAHNALTHGHDYNQQDEERDHAKEAHVHDHGGRQRRAAELTTKATRSS